jgi:hypothetical protein
MTDVPRPATLASRVLASLRRPGRAQVQALALIAAAAFAYNGARILENSPERTTPNLDNLDVSLPWLGAALVALLLAAWQPSWPRPRLRREALAAFWREHWLELLIFAGIFAFGVFMRVYRFQTSLPPADGICCEEAINGGAAYKALHGLRPLNFLITRWGSAAGFAVFGETTLGLRFFFVAMSIVTLAAFYLLLRELVSRHVALFGMALYAAAWWPSLRARQASEGTIYAVLFALVLVRGLRTKSPVLLLCAGVLAGLLSYEYEPFKAVPIVGALFLGAAAVREVLLRAPFTTAAALARARALFDAAWRPLLIALMATAVVLIPMIVGTHRGYDLYLTSVHRQESGRGGERIADRWRTQLKWEAQIFSPVGPNDYPTAPPRDIPGMDLLDPLAGWLAVAGFAAGLALVLRGYRALFAGWVVVSLGAGALLLADFGPWKFITLVPVFLVLAAFLLDDARALAMRRFGQRGVQWFAALLAAGAAFSFWWNADTLFRNVESSVALVQNYAGEKAMVYDVCHYLQGRDDENYSVASSSSTVLHGFAQRRDSFDAQTRAWGDYVWACHDLQGTALPAPEEAWPLRDLPPGPITLLIADPGVGVENVMSQLRLAYEGLPPPTRLVSGPLDSYAYVAYEFADRSQLNVPGLWAVYSPAGLPASAVTRIDALNDFSWNEAGLPLPLPFTVRWRGLVYLAEQATVSLHALTDEPVDIRLDGQSVYDTRAGEEQDRAIELVAGWHVVEITLDKQREGGSVRLAWVAPGGSQRELAADDLFPLAVPYGWVQQRSLGLPGVPDQQVTQRIDFAPHEVSARVAMLLAQTGAFEPIVTEESWRAVWQVDRAADYLLRARFRAGTVMLLVDGAEVAMVQAPLQGAGELAATVSLTAGPHTIELVQKLDFDTPWVGLTLEAFLQGQPVEMDVRPY